VARDYAHRAVRNAKKVNLTHPVGPEHMACYLRLEASILGSLGRLDEAVTLDLEILNLSPGYDHPDPGTWVRSALAHMATGEEAEAEEILRSRLSESTEDWHHLAPNKVLEGVLRPNVVLAELLEGRGTEKARTEATMLRDAVAGQMARHGARRAAALKEIRAAAAEEVRQWRGERIKAREEEKGGKGKSKGKTKGKKKGRKGKAKGKGASTPAAIEGGRPHEAAGGEAEGAAAGEGAAATQAQQQPPVGGTQPPGQEQSREECAICLHDLELEDDEDPRCDEGGEGEALVVLKCGHRFHEICGDMWCAKCADKGWGVICPRCRAPYVRVRR
jgi:hypothetical protein